MDAKKEKKEPKVTIELITDGAVVSTVMASGASGVKPLILMSGDRMSVTLGGSWTRSLRLI